MSQHSKKKKAFTLTELLVVVVVIGVLAAVSLPKFNKIMETRKVTEAEEIMASIRTEQEHRCAMDKPYAMDFDKLSNNSFAQVQVNQAETSHFTYGLEGIGMLASSKGKYNYQLEMPSYADGRLCCSGEGCTQLNKDYPSCDELKNKPDYQMPTQCTPEDIDPSHQNPVITPPVPCAGKPQPASRSKNCNSEEDGGSPDLCGLVTTSYKCEDDEWVPYDYPSCTPQYKAKETPCDCGPAIVTPYVCSQTEHRWVLGTPSAEACLERPEEERDCVEGEGKETREVWCENNEWKTSLEWNKEGCVLPQNACQEYATKRFTTSWESACADYGTKIKNSNYAGGAITSDAAFKEDCCQEAHTCAEWISLYSSLSYYEVTSWTKECAKSYKLKNTYSGTDVTNDDFVDKCCTESPYKTEEGYVVEVDWTGNWRSGASMTGKSYFTTSGLDTSGFIQQGGSNCTSGGPGCYVTSDCSWDEDCFEDVDELGHAPTFESVEQSSNPDAFCFPCNEKKGCPDVADTKDATVMAQGGYAYAGGDAHGGDPCSNHDGYGDNGNNNVKITYYSTCTSDPANPNNPNPEVAEIRTMGAACKSAVLNGGTIGCGKGDWLDLVAQASGSFKQKIGCPGQDTGQLCTSTIRLYYRPKITIYRRFYCVSK